MSDAMDRWECQTPGCQMPAGELRREVEIEGMRGTLVEHYCRRCLTRIVEEDRQRNAVENIPPDIMKAT